ncbi:ferredoxin [Nonomuraea soli]|uniref:Ferredoxin n=1 Tax=Nonomuraea soli TaxID=1032476 RepID=A0A7W0CRU6_9ACTN|nr:ferredoxin [Nonomuraea soli]MBA2896179.1 ferredoxin [Nonomuraea soli]
MVIVVDRERCAAAGQCVTWAPRFFGQDPDDGRVILLAEASGVPEVRRAVTGCPTGALSWG